jgi:hypothetical protein
MLATVMRFTTRDVGAPLATTVSSIVTSSTIITTCMPMCTIADTSIRTIVGMFLVATITGT